MSQLKKLEIVAYKDEEYSSETGDKFTVMINPSNYKHNYGINYNEEQINGKAGIPLKFTNYNAENIDFEFVIDGTGVVSQSNKPVNERVEDLKKVVYAYNGSIHQPNYIKVKWGSLEFNGRLSSLSADYNLFKPDGLPLRAKLNLSIKSHISEKKEALLATRQSPDITHIITVKGGDSLPMLCYEVYEDSSYYEEVARVNGLTSFRNIKPGDKLTFPPLK